ncbi:transcription elongation factor A N-terminal and central domain-containing protein 2-like [Dreissena polymorpha]|uniref:transcription elongation factor A N-terminal and central domain-containing protein 2-like n=1 Tax=Dreissena polymorpha TaxID=45954 RepID=UPI0022644AF7|nr:transcription elongation factor A N-terminal and central domain-containing protein 2-like [Dreissena polymorpha]
MGGGYWCGKVLNKLRKCEDADIRRAAKNVYEKWKTHFITAHMCVLLLDGSELSQAIERETFHEHKGLISNAYKRTIRNLVLVLTNQADIRAKVLPGKINVTGFVKTNTKSGSMLIK